MTPLSAMTFIIMALLLLVLPLDWLLAAIFAGLFHELCHIFTVYAMNGRILRIEIHFMGCILETGKLGDWKQFVSTLAGPVGSLVLLCLYRFAPKVAVCGLVQGIYNLMPVYPLDGGRLLRLILQHLCPGYTEIIQFIVAVVTFLAIDLFVMIFVFSSQMGLCSILIMLIWNIRLLPRKIPCKPSQIGVQ